MAKGHGGARPNSGRKPKGEIEELQRVLEEAVPFEERVDAMRVLLSRAKTSDVGAMKLLFGYLYGTPVQRTVAEISGANGGPIEIKTIEAVKPPNERPDGDN